MRAEAIANRVEARDEARREAAEHRDWLADETDLVSREQAHREWRRTDSALSLGSLIWSQIDMRDDQHEVDTLMWTLKRFQGLRILPRELEAAFDALEAKVCALRAAEIAEEVQNFGESE